MKQYSFVRDEELADWLEAFFSYTDRRRLGRAILLYQSGAIIDFNKQKNGFAAKIKGSRDTPYIVHARYDTVGNRKLPSPASVWTDCSCPDDAEICKHAICTVIHWMTVIEKERRGHRSIPDINWVESPVRKAASVRRSSPMASRNAAFETLQQLAKNRQPAVQQFHDNTPFWHAKPDLNTLMEKIYDKVQSDLRQDLD